MTSLEDPTEIIAEPAGYFMAPIRRRNESVMYRMYYSQTDGLKMITEKFISIMRLRTPVFM